MILPERQATICLPRAAQTMQARPIPSTGYRQFASQAVEKTATLLVSSACEPKPVSTARECYSPDRALTPVRWANVAGCVSGTIKLLHYCGFADRAKEGPRHLSTLRPMQDTRKKQTRVALTGVSGGQTC